MIEQRLMGLGLLIFTAAKCCLPQGEDKQDRETSKCMNTHLMSLMILTKELAMLSKMSSDRTLPTMQFHLRNEKHLERMPEQHERSRRLAAKFRYT